jgi:hypothetical protein
MITKQKAIVTTIDWFTKLSIVVLMYFAVYQNIWVAKNLIYFLNFLVGLSTLYVLFAKDEAKEDYKKNKNRTYIPGIETFYLWVMILSFAAMGWFGSAFIWFTNWAAITSFVKEQIQ